MPMYAHAAAVTVGAAAVSLTIEWYLAAVGGASVLTETKDFPLVDTTTTIETITTWLQTRAVEVDDAYTRMTAITSLTGTLLAGRVLYP